MNGEPQGGIKFRRRGAEANVRYERPRDRLPSWPSPFAGPFPPGNPVSLCHLVHAERARRAAAANIAGRCSHFFHQPSDAIFSTSFALAPRTSFS